MLDKNISEEGVLEEAEFYNITGLIRLLKDKIRIRDLELNGDKKEDNKHVYRVYGFFGATLSEDDVLRNKRKRVFFQHRAKVISLQKNSIIALVNF